MAYTAHFGHSEGIANDRNHEGRFPNEVSRIIRTSRLKDERIEKITCSKFIFDLLLIGGRFDDGELTITGIAYLLGLINPKHLTGTVVHEVGHSLSPFIEENNDVYGSLEDRLEVSSYIKEIADQSMTTGVYLNQYHKYLSKPTLFWDIEKFYEETFTILLEMRYANPDQLLKIQEAQSKVLRDKYNTDEYFIPLMSQDVSDSKLRKDQMPEGIDSIIIKSLSKNISNLEELDMAVKTCNQGGLKI